jgi:hypothetical protein
MYLGYVPAHLKSKGQSESFLHLTAVAGGVKEMTITAIAVKRRNEKLNFILVFFC